MTKLQLARIVYDGIKNDPDLNYWFQFWYSSSEDSSTHLGYFIERVNNATGNNLDFFEVAVGLNELMNVWIISRTEQGEWNYIYYFNSY